MIRIIAALRALPVTFVVFVLETALSALIGAPLALEIQRAMPGPHDAAGRAALLDTLVAWAPLLRLVSTQMLLVAAGWLLISPALQMAWLDALSKPTSVEQALREGSRRWLRAFIVTLLVGLGTLLLATPFALAAWGTGKWLDAEEHARAHDLGVAMAVAPLLLVLFMGHVWHDLARARSLTLGAFRSVIHALRDAFTPAVLIVAALLAAGGFGLYVGGDTLASRVHGSGLGPRALSVSLVHGALLARTFVRSIWLAHTLAAAER